jgi:hypothetical protein
MKSGKKSKILSPVTLFLVLAAAAGLMTTAIMEGIVPGFVIGGIYSRSPTITYQGSLAVNYVGVYHVIQAQPICNSAFPPCFAANETVFFLSTRNGTIRLVFYCGKTMQGLTTITGWVDFCSNASQLQPNDGVCLHVEGTLLQPSSWPNKQYLPSLRFDADLFVFSYTQVPQATCL